MTALLIVGGFVALLTCLAWLTDQPADHDHLS